jgi:hypothetical protein
VVALPALASLNELEARLGLDSNTLAGADKARAQAALDDASALVRLEAGQSWVVAGALSAVPDVISRVVLGAAMRNWINPDGVVQETAGPFQRRLAESPNGVYLTAAEVEIVRRFRASGTSDLWTLATERDRDTPSTIWYQTSVGCEWFPLASGDDVVWPA